jgi:hypothetical protein
MKPRRVADTTARRISDPGADGTRDAGRIGMCLTCGCMDAHLAMGESNITYEDVKKAADENRRSVRETLDIVDRTVAADKEKHAAEYE